jgi:hypothetical protein
MDLLQQNPCEENRGKQIFKKLKIKKNKIQPLNSTKFKNKIK